MPWAVVFQRVDEVSRHPAQLYEATFLIFIFVLFRFLYLRFKENFAKGVLFFYSMISYLSFRIFVEAFKIKGTANSPFDVNITVGQKLSIFAIIILIILIVLRNRAEKNTKGRKIK